MSALKPTVGPVGASALAVGIVIGAGMLALPGLVRCVAGDWATLAWMLDALMVTPLLVIFSWLGRRYPGAGGLAGFVAAAYPSAARSCGYLLLGTFSLGLPAIAMTGAAYVVDGLGLAAGGTRGLAIALIAAGFLGVGLTTAWMGARTADAVQRAVVSILIVALGLVALAGFSTPHLGRVMIPPGPPPVAAIWRGMTVAFFAFTGWEVLAFTTGEFRNPRRDFPIAVAVSFVVVTTLYIGVSLAVAGGPMAARPEAALIGVAAGWIGTARAGPVSALVVAAIIVVNLNGGVWGVSRLVYAMACDGCLPTGLRLDALNEGTPRRAVFALGGIWLAVLLLAACRVVTLDQLLTVAGQDFFVLYGLSVAAFIKLAAGWPLKVFGLAAAAIAVVFMGGWGYSLLYAAALLALPFALDAVQRRRLQAGRV